MKCVRSLEGKYRRYLSIVPENSGGALMNQWRPKGEFQILPTLVIFATVNVGMKLNSRCHVKGTVSVQSW